MGKASSLFNGAGSQTLYRRVVPTEEQRTFLQEQWNELAEHLKAELYADYGYPITTWIQGSYKFGTLIRPVRFGDEYDVDLGIYFELGSEGDAKPAPEQLRDWVQRELKVYKDTRADIKSMDEPPKERCSRLIYERQFHIDTPVYEVVPSKDYRRLACLSGKWEESDPKKIYKWFRDTLSAKDLDQLRRIIRYLKGWAAIGFDEAPESRPSSIFLTVVATEVFENQWYERFVGLDDEDALILIVKKMHDRLQNNSEVKNPVERDENLNRISEDAWNGFLSRLQAFRDAAERAEVAEDEISAALAWSESLSYLMPLSEAMEVEVADEGSQHALMIVPDIKIHVYRRNPKQLIGQFDNEVAAVAKDCDLVFTITNPHIIPDYATIEWTVRNDGDDASYLGDLGHRRIGIRNYSTEEHTAYAGLHYMDCIIRLNGQVYAVRRVPVHVKDIQYPDRNPPRPAYTKIRSLRKRRR
ncbi:CBASS cGAMP synthase [Herminiimonas fonticola]|uniref:Cyclic GMP-AMP synthase n=1 Tax=Herminiimonas fonticola TaxID=303380 RepID=A0A4R6FZ75_9BURK|nr:nucleotidyltransferase [Herminiimonas fonticola]RBA24362.1 hypothetical protein Hfont_2174 [Herminiimonas fonticola]TDN87306.1 hypothetical protein EV677_3017 [Herminiimonas fonticola]